MVTTGTRLADRYVLGERIATGGMGAVFAANDERLGRKVAVKLLKDELVEDERFVERFRREARAAAALSHPNIAAVFDYGEDDSCNFIVMEYAAGADLSRLLRDQGPLAEERSAYIVAQVCRALAHAHAAGVIHRDVKPANIIVGDADRVKVTDFGIARAVGDSTLTATGSVLGTAHYLSPEQASGGPMTPASDLYSLGIVLYETLTGALPFTGDTPVTVAMRHVSDDVPAPSLLNPETSSAMDAIVARATARPLDKRYGSATEMADDLDAIGSPTAPGALAEATATAEIAGHDGSGPPPLPLPSYDAYRLGRTVLLILAALGLIAALLLAWRLASGGDTPEPGSRPGRRSVAPGVRQITIPEAIEGMDVKDAEELLTELGLIVTTDEIAVEDFPKDAVVSSTPAPGTSVDQGSLVTLHIATEPPDDNGGGKGHGKGKGNGKDDD